MLELNYIKKYALSLLFKLYFAISVNFKVTNNN